MVKPINRTVFGILILLASILSVISATPVLAGGTTSITITKYASDGTTVLDQKTVDYQTLESTLPVQGDGVTHQYVQGPTFAPDNLWDSSETINIKDYGANKGTDLKDLCELVGGMSPGDTVEIKAIDNFSKIYDYPNVYTPQASQGKMVICWWCDGQYVPAWSDGMRLMFFAETKTGDKYIFGNWDEHECLPSNRWHYFYSDGIGYPTTTGLAVKYVNRINIYSSQAVNYNLTIEVNGSGTTAPSSGSHSYDPGTVVDITATPASGWQFSEWVGSGIADPELASTTVVMDGDKTVTANFTQEAAASNYDLTMSVNGSGTTAPSSGSHSYAQGTVVDITATPASGWHFSEWVGSGIDDPNSASTTVTMDGNKTIAAKFTQKAQNETVPPGNTANAPTSGKSLQEMQLYIILAVAAVIVALIIILVALFRRRG
jgi:hypothetical protein